MSRPTPSSSALKLSEVMKSGKYSDLTFVCDGDEFKVHKVIVCPQSDVLSAAVDGSFKASCAETAFSVLLSRTIR